MIIYSSRTDYCFRQNMVLFRQQEHFLILAHQLGNYCTYSVAGIFYLSCSHNTYESESFINMSKLLKSFFDDLKRRLISLDEHLATTMRYLYYSIQRV